MDDARFDQVARSLQSVAPRRGMLGLLLGGALGLAGLADSPAKKKGKGKKKKKKDVCKQVSDSCGDGGCAFGARCCQDYDCDSCSNSFCRSTGSKDGIGTCGCLSTHQFFNGACGEKPECLPAGTVRGFYDIRCCSGSQDMESDVCLPGYLSCLSNEDCVGGQCRGYVCAASTLECQGK